MKPIIQTKEQLLDALRAITEAVENDDSFEGSIDYIITETRHQFEVMVFWRVGNSEGQGGSIMIGDTSDTSA